MTQGEPVLTSNTTTTTTTSTLSPTTPTGVGTDERHLEDGGPSTTDTIAAITIAVLSCILVIALTLIIRAIRQRRRQQRGQELNRVHTVSTGIISANVGAYGAHHVQARPQPRPSSSQASASSARRPPRSHYNAQLSSQGIISWEPVTPATSTSSVDMPSTSGGGPS